MKIVLKLNVPKWQKALAGLGDRFDKAITAAMNMAASMAKYAADRDISSAGKFGSRWTDALKVGVSGSLNNMKISMTLGIGNGNIFETGGDIAGNPFLWLPLSGTDAEGTQAKDYPDQLFSAKSASGTPLLFSMSDKMPKYHGTEKVTIPKLFHLREDLLSVQANFRAVFDAAWQMS